MDTLNAHDALTDKAQAETAQKPPKWQRVTRKVPFLLGSKKNEFSTENTLSLSPEKNFCCKTLPNNVANVADVATLDLSLAIDAEAESINAAKLIIDDVLDRCKDMPDLLFSEKFIEALKLIRTDKSLWAMYRVKIKTNKPSGVKLSDIDDATAVTGESEHGGKDSTASELIELVINSSELFFDDRNDKCFISTDIDGVVHTLAIGSKAFVEWLSFSYYKASKQNGNMGKSASESAIKNASFALGGIAKHEGKKQRVHLRVADHNGGHYLFIGDDKLQVIEVLSTGWRIVENPPVKFWKSSSMQALPLPQPGGDLSLLWKFINIPKKDRLLVLAWVLESFRAETPKPILSLTGIQGCAKSSTQSKIRELIDNNSSNLRAAPKAVEDVFISAGCNWLSSYENLSHLTAKMQDALCTLATGGGHSSRTLYTNDEETIIEAKRPVVINSIPNVITAQDLTDRSICIELPRIEYREESEINTAWEIAKPAIFGGLLDLFVKTLENLPKVTLEKPPRMADFTRLGEAMAQAQGFDAGVFDALYRANRAESIANALESSPAALAVCTMVDSDQGGSPTVFHGTVDGLLDRLAQYQRDSNGWPKSAKGLSVILKRQLPALDTLGINITFGSKVERIDGHRGMPITVKKSGNIGNVGMLDFKKTPAAQNLQPKISGFLSDDAEIF